MIAGLFEGIKTPEDWYKVMQTIMARLEPEDRTKLVKYLVVAIEETKQEAAKDDLLQECRDVLKVEWDLYYRDGDRDLYPNKQTVEALLKKLEEI